MSRFPQTLINVRMAARVEVNESKDILAMITGAEQRIAERGRVLVRASGTEPVLRVMVEGEDAGEVTAVAESLAEDIRRLTAA